jgi:hypothetical protein
VSREVSKRELWISSVGSISQSTPGFPRSDPRPPSVFNSTVCLTIVSTFQFPERDVPKHWSFQSQL